MSTSSTVLKLVSMRVVFWVFVMGVLIMFSGCSDHTGTDQVSLKSSSETLNDEVSSIVIQDQNIDENGYWVGYEKPEGWITLTNKEFSFVVDIPESWEVYSDSESSLIFGAEKGMMISSGQGTNVRFVINANDDNGMLKSLDLMELTDNEELVRKAGNAFKYFRGAYSNEIQNDDLIVFYSVGTSVKDMTKDNFISVNANENIPLEDLVKQEEDIETMKTIIKSFRKF